MKRYDNLLLNVWREACRHIELSESIGTISRLLSESVPIQCLLVRRFNPEHQSLETLAFGAPTQLLPPPADALLTAGRFTRLVEWAKGQVVEHSNGARRISEIALVTPEELTGDVLLGPLANADGPVGVLLLISESNRLFRAEHIPLMHALLEPFSVALENDHRMHQLTSLREAAEADRRTLLTRLGRQEMTETVVGADSGLSTVMERVELVSTSDVPVLILGETGTGKEVIARAIHTRSARSRGPFIRVNCGAIPADLIDSHLFGHEKGSFTGASETRKGWFERADGGTLFLDEIGELPLEAQVRLLRVLQDGYVERVGGQQSIRVDVRMVAATHRDLRLMITQSSFREDLWYRIAIFPINLPPLRDRLQDIPQLARHFAERAANRFGLSRAELSEEHLRILSSYHWPGNIRELGSVMDRAAILGDGRTLEIAKAIGVGAVRDIEPALPILNGSSKLEPLNDAMKRHIARALNATRGRIEGSNGAAALLGINPHTLRARMRKLSLEWGSFRRPHVS